MAVGVGFWRTALIVIALCAGTAANAAPKVKPSASLQVVDNDFARTLAVAGFKGGGGFVAFSDGQEIKLRYVARDGSLTNTLQLSIDGHAEFGVQQAAVARLSSGEVVTAWSATPSAREAIFARVVKSNGLPAGGEIKVSDAPTVSNTDPAVTAFGKDKFAVAWAAFTDSGGSSLSVRVYDATGKPLALPVTITPPAGVAILEPALAPFGKGFVMAYQLGSKGLFAQTFSAKGKKTGDPVRLDAANTLVHEDVKLAPLSGGGYAAIWNESKYSEAGGLAILVDTTIKGRIIDKKGRKQNALSIEDKIDEKSLERGVTPIETDAGLFVAWSADAGEDDNDVRGAFVSAAGKAGAIKRLTKSGDHDQFFPRLALLSDGRLLLGYSVFSGPATDDPLGAFATFLKISD